MGSSALKNRLGLYCDLLKPYLDQLSFFAKNNGTEMVVGTGAGIAGLTAGAPFIAVGAILIILKAALDFKNAENTDQALVELQEKLNQLSTSSDEAGQPLTDNAFVTQLITCLLYTSPSPRDLSTSRMPSSA